MGSSEHKLEAPDINEYVKVQDEVPVGDFYITRLFGMWPMGNWCYSNDIKIIYHDSNFYFENEEDKLLFDMKWK